MFYVIYAVLTSSGFYSVSQKNCSLFVFAITSSNVYNCWHSDTRINCQQYEVCIYCQPHLMCVPTLLWCQFAPKGCIPFNLAWGRKSKVAPSRQISPLWL